MLQLFRPEKIEGSSDPDSIVTFAVKDILASHAQLGRTIQLLSKHLDTLDQITDAVSDSDVRAQFKDQARRSRECLANAMVSLSHDAGIALDAQ